MGKGDKIESPPAESDGLERDADPLNKSFGEIVRKLRHKAGMTLEDLAVASKVSRAMLSSVERGAKSPTLSVLSGIAEGLGVTMSQLMSEETSAAPVSVIPRARRHVFRDEVNGIERHLLSPTHLDTGIELIEHILPPGQVVDGFPHVGMRTDKYIVVSEGKLSVEMAETTYTLDEADAIHFQVRGNYRLVNHGRRLCRYYLFIVHRRE